MLLANLRATVLAIWAALGVPESRDATILADVIARTIVDDAPNAPVWGSHDEDLAVMALTVAEDSGVMIHPIPRSWEQIGGMSCGPFWEPCFMTRSHTLGFQAMFWLKLVRSGLPVCPKRPVAPDPDRCRSARDVADERVERARALLGVAIAD